MVGGPRQLATGPAKRISVNTAHLPGEPIMLEFGGGGDDTFLSITHYETIYKIHMEFKYKLQIFEEILAYSWPLWAPTSSQPPLACNHVRGFSW